MNTEMHDTFDSRSKILNGIYYAALLHDHPELVDDCCKLINMEWQRSHAARLRSISGSSSNFPTSVILLKESKDPRIIGHCKITNIPHSRQIVFVQSVVIHPDFRGKGLGKLLMQKTEQYLKSKNIEWVYLTTSGQQTFYEKLGYSQCEPINIHGIQLSHLLESNKKIQTPPNSLVQVSKQSSGNCGENPEHILKYSHSLQNGPSPPPPPPMPSYNSSKITYLSSNKTFMRKKLLHMNV